MAVSSLSNPSPVVLDPQQLASRSLDGDVDPTVTEIYDLIRDIKDPEHPHTLEELNVVREDLIFVNHLKSTNGQGRGGEEGGEAPLVDELRIRIDFTPTVPHCSLAALIGLCLRVKLERNLTQQFKLDIFVTEGTHSVEEDVNRQINDKERVAAAMENPGLREMVEECIKEAEY